MRKVAFLSLALLLAGCASNPIGNSTLYSAKLTVAIGDLSGIIAALGNLRQ